MKDLYYLTHLLWLVPGLSTPTALGQVQPQTQRMTITGKVTTTDGDDNARATLYSKVRANSTLGASTNVSLSIQHYGHDSYARAAGQLPHNGQPLRAAKRQSEQNSGC